jgi:hypothetical protein
LPFVSAVEKGEAVAASVGAGVKVEITMLLDFFVGVEVMLVGLQARAETTRRQSTA